MIIICGHIFANLTAESVRDVLQLEDFTTYLGIYAASRVIRYPELRELLADPIAQHWASLTGITSTARESAADELDGNTESPPTSTSRSRAYAANPESTDGHGLRE